MPLVLGLWGERRRSSRHKLDLFSNKKVDLLGLIEKGRLKIGSEGVLVNLDTGVAYGGAFNKPMVEIGKDLDSFWKKNEGKTERTYRLVQRMARGQSSPEETKIWGKLLELIKGTQLYSCYLQSGGE